MSRVCRLLGWSVACLVFALTPAWAQTCYTADDMDVTTKASLEQAGQQLLAMSARGDFAGLRSQAVPSLAGNFSGIEAAVTEHQKDFQGGAQTTATGVFLLDTGSTQTLARAEFYCGIFNSPDRVSFVIPNLPPGKFGVVTESVHGPKPFDLTMVLQQSGAAWKLAGYTITPKTVGGHDAAFLLAQARAYHAKGANLAAYLYYLEGWELSAPVRFEYNVTRDKIADEMQAAKPADLPTPQAPLMLMAGGKSYRVTQIFPEAVGNDLDLIVKYQAVSDINNTTAAFQDNTAVIKAVVSKYPELREAFAGVVARAVDATGHDYGTLLAMKDVK